MAVLLLAGCAADPGSLPALKQQARTDAYRDCVSAFRDREIQTGAHIDHQTYDEACYAWARRSVR